MNKEILTRNLLILHQLKEVTSALNTKNIPVILLKGVALIELFPEYSAERMMDDIDLLIRPGDRTGVRKVLGSLGYSCSNNDPGAFTNPEKTAAVDITDNIWYLSKEENRKLWDSGESILPTDELYIHVLAHAAVHHAQKQSFWYRDLEILNLKWGSVEDKLKKYGLKEVSEVYLNKCSGSLSFEQSVYKWLLNRDIPMKGHLLRFMLLPLKRKFNYLVSAMFPSNDFIEYRYNLEYRWQIPLYRILRPFLQIVKLIQIPFALR